MDIEKLKKDAALQAVAQIRSGMIVGLGTGSTSRYAIDAIGERVAREGLDIIGVPTSSRSAEQARSLNIPLSDLDAHPHLDLAIDGADEIEVSTLNLIKGAGVALLQEKLVEISARRLIIIADATKKVEQLGERFALPVEVVRFGWRATHARLEALGCQATRRCTPEGQPYVTDEQHYLLDCRFGPIADSAALAARIKAIVGVIEHGLFIGMADEAIIATERGLETLRRP